MTKENLNGMGWMFEYIWAGFSAEVMDPNSLGCAENHSQKESM